MIKEDIRKQFIEQIRQQASQKVERHRNKGEADPDKLFEIVMKGVRQNKSFIFRNTAKMLGITMEDIEEIVKEVVKEK